MSSILWLRRAICMLTLLLGGCGAGSLVKSNQPVKIGSATVTSPIEWNQFSYGRERMWTLDGSMLNALHIYTRIKDREELTLAPRRYGRFRNEGQLYRADMTELEIVELFADKLKSEGGVAVRSRALRPAKFGSLPGFRFELSWQTSTSNAVFGAGGLNYRGMVIAEIQGKTLSYLLYAAPEEHYFARNVAHVEKIFASIQAKPD